MWKAIKYLFYNYYLFYKNAILGYNQPQITATLVVAGLFFAWVNIIRCTILPHFSINKQIWLIFVILSLAVWHYVFFHKNRWKEIIKEFENESKEQRKKRRILSVSFTVFSIVMLIVSFFILAYILHGDTPF